MAHSRLALTIMFDWIEARISAGQPTPTDPEICERFTFANPESARTLLAELADAGRITIKGYGDTRKVTLGRQRSALEPVERPVPSVTKADPEVDAATARIASILNRDKRARAVVAQNASKLLASVKPPAAPAAAKPAKEPVMAKAPQRPAAPTITSIVADLHTVFDALVDRADAADRAAAQSTELAAAIKRAEAAEARAAEAERKLNAMREALAS